MDTRFTVQDTESRPPRLNGKIIMQLSPPAKRLHNSQFCNLITLPSEEWSPSRKCIVPPTLFVIYTADAPPPGNADCMNLYYADDATQLIVSNGTLADHDTLVQREATRLNNYERTWKIKTNIDKFALVALGRKNLNDIRIQGNTIPHQQQCRILAVTR